MVAVAKDCMGNVTDLKTLVLETSTSHGSVALFEGERLLFSESFPAGRSLGSELFAVLERALNLGSDPGSALPVQSPVRLGQIVVGLGPGSYAGVRIAISAAIGLALASGAKLLGLPSIAALDEGDYIALGDARRESFYFARVRGGECVEGPELVPAEELAGRLAAFDSENLPCFASEPLDAVPWAQLRFPDAERLGRLAIAGRAVAARDHLEPIYLRPPHITQPKGTAD